MDTEFNSESYHYNLPADQIAQIPTESRDNSRLFVLDARDGTMQDLNFIDILKFFQAGDLIVVNDTKVFPARFEGKKDSGGKIEFFLLEYPDFSTISTTETLPENGTSKYKCTLEVTGLLKSSKRPKVGAYLIFSHSLKGELLQLLDDGKVRIKLSIDIHPGENPEDILMQCGRVPLPPYIRRDGKDHPDDRERYQTLFARKSGAIAAPTAGLHFSEHLLAKLQEKNIEIAPITLHVGYGTFAPVRAKDIRQHEIHQEYVEVSQETAELINRKKKSGNKIWAVGTTTVRTLEFAASDAGLIEARRGWCGLYIYPGYKFKLVDSLITNFHLPGSSLLFLVSALAGRTRILNAYSRAIELGYRFYSYGDAMLIIT